MNDAFVLGGGGLWKRLNVEHSPPHCLHPLHVRRSSPVHSACWSVPGKRYEHLEGQSIESSGPVESSLAHPAQ